ncbi:hypothetical protein L596_019214 [Steinernema carpocapsae]|uniref:Uncharacterized protein n=1 Tax=Steinernema carpocapsae TaxID=34508 RepID=A0A4U5MPN1_STECR|nr:hypothetical protein L596_019214 [Steinernema carpocapsae]
MIRVINNDPHTNPSLVFDVDICFKNDAAKVVFQQRTTHNGSIHDMWLNWNQIKMFKTNAVYLRCVVAGDKYEDMRCMDVFGKEVAQNLSQEVFEDDVLPFLDDNLTSQAGSLFQFLCSKSELSSKLLKTFEYKTYNQYLTLKYAGKDTEQFLKAQTENPNLENVKLLADWP